MNGMDGSAPTLMDVDAFVMRKADEFLNVATKESAPGEAGAKSCGVSGRTSPYFDAKEAEKRASAFREALLPGDRDTPLKQYLNMLGSYEDGVGCGVNWIDLFYRSFDHVASKDPDEHSNYHSLLNARGRGAIDGKVRDELKAAWNVYAANPDRTFVTATVFEKIASERNRSGLDSEKGGNTQRSFRTGAAFTNLDQKTAEACIGKGPQIFTVDNETFRLEDNHLESLGLRSGQNVAFGRLTQLYELAFGTNKFVYLYIPHSVRAHNVHVGTAVGIGIWGSCDLGDLKMLINRLVALAGIWARQVAEFDTERKVIAATRRALMASLMTRNISHNIGSHVLASDQLTRARRSLGSRVIPNGDPRRPSPDLNLVFGKIPRSEQKTAAVNTMANLAQERQRAAQQFDAYLQDRMDFVALAVGAESGQAHPVPMQFRADILDPYTRNHLLLGSLLRDQNYTTFASELSGSVHSFCISCPANDARDPYVAIPGGVAGRQAFYCILENIARNAAKYGTHRGKHDLNVDIEIRDAGEGCWRVSITENLSDPTVTISTSRGTATLIEYLACLLGEDHVVSVSGGEWGLTDEGRGLQEMKACAEFLRGRASVSGKPPLVASERSGKLCFEFDLLRPCFLRRLLFDCSIVPSITKDLVVGELQKFSNGAPCEVMAIAVDTHGDHGQLSNFLALLGGALDELQHLLPARQVCVVNDDQAVPASNRNFAIVSSSTLYKTLCDGDPAKVEYECSEALLEVFRHWLWSFCPPANNGWNMRLYIDRPRAECPTYNVSAKAPRVNVVLRASDDTDSDSVSIDVDFANHSVWSPTNEAPCRIKFGNANSLALYTALTKPPTEECQCTWFILNLVESSLARVGVFDERLDQAIVGNKKLLFELNEARVYRVDENEIRGTSNPVEKPPYDLLLVHLGLIEQIMGGNSVLTEEQLQARFKVLARRTVLVTGRGGNRGKLAMFPVIEYSLVCGSLMMGVDKRLLVTAALGARVPQIGTNPRST